MKKLPPRPRLESLLDGALAHRLTVLVADAGFGKTTLLTSWSAGINAVVYPLTKRDRDLTQLWRRLVETLRRSLAGGLPGAAGNADAEGLGLGGESLWAGSTEAVRGPVSPHSDSVRPQAMAELLGHALEQRLTRDLVLVLDDAHLVSTGPAASFLAGLVRHAPPLLHVVMATRGPMPVPMARLRTQGQVLEVTGAELAFTTGEVAALLAEVVGTGDGPAAPVPAAGGEAEPVRLATGGWPMAVRLAVESLREVPPAGRVRHVAGLATHGQLTDLIRATYVQETAAVRRLLAIGALFDRFTVGLCEALGVAGAAPLVAGMARRGLFVERAPEEPVAGDPIGSGSPDTGDWYRLHPLARWFITEQAALPPGEVAALHEAAARWFVENGAAHLALRLLVSHGNHDRVAELLAGAGERLAISGHPDVVVAAVDSLPPQRRGAQVERLAGHAYLFRGEWDAALACYHRAAAASGAEGGAGDGDHPLPAALAWRIGLIHYLRGDHDIALATFQRADLDPAGPGDRDSALALAWAATVHWVRGDRGRCGELAARALRVATAVADPAALAAAHTVLSMLAATEGDRRANAAHYARALEYARQAGDVLQLIRIHSNRASHSLEEGDSAPAMAELDAAIRLADLYGYGGFGGLALTNRAQIRIRLGQLEEAHHDVEAALAVFDDLGSRKAAYPLTTLGDLHRLRGDGTAAVKAYERALALVERNGDRQVQVLALAGLARALAGQDPDRAAAVAEQALACGDGLGYVTALLAAARVALDRGAAEPARQWARQAGAVAGERRDRPGVAEAEELAAAATGDPAGARELAERSVARWGEIGDPIGRARAELVLAERLHGPAAGGARGAAIAVAVRTRMAALGCRPLAARAAALLAQRAYPAGPAPRPVRVETLGTFRVVRGGAVVPSSAWRSRKARDALKILLARRGRPVTRDFLMEALWPGEPPGPLANRLHVAVSTLRSVLDPEHSLASDAFVATDDDTVRVRYEQLEVDVELFLEDASAGLVGLRTGAGDRAAALSRLARAESRYGGDFLEADLYEDWAVPLREQARAAYVEVAARLAEHAEAAGETEAAARYLLRILEHDPYDERAHLRLVAAFGAMGRHGDARRHYRHYCARMDELDVEAAPFPARGPAHRPSLSPS